MGLSRSTSSSAVVESSHAEAAASTDSSVSVGSSVEEDIVIYKLPGEKLGLGLRFDGGGNSQSGSQSTKSSSETVRRLFVQVLILVTPLCSVLLCYLCTK